MRAFSLCLRVALVLALLVQLRTASLGAPFAEQVPFTQPDGTQIVLWGEGDEFYAVFETLQGYTVIFNPQTRAYKYASLSADGSQLLPTGIIVGRGNPAASALKQHVRVNREAIRKQVAERFARWDEGMEMTRRWEELKGARRLAEQTYSAQAVPNSPPSATTTGPRLGLTLLIDFSDAAATIPQADMDALCNGDNYSGYGNNGSVKNYFLEVSNSQLTYSNVVTVYIRAPQPKTYYNDTAVDDGVEGRKLITEVINVMKGLPNYTNEILPTFANLSVDGSSRVRACNVFFAGANSGVWAKGLWPHSSSLSSSVDLGNGKKVSRYQITNIGTSPGIGTFCHENGHMLCGFPDLYDYDYDSKGGAGNFCLMGYGNAAHTPVQVCAYLKRAAGWASTTEWTSDTALTATVGSSGTNFNRFYRYAKPGVNTEYFLIENRQKSGRDSSLPGSGIAIWHVDELGNRDNQSTNFNTTHANYELSLMQADNLWHLQNNSNSGDSKDLYYLGNTAAGYNNQFSDSTSPGARWWSGVESSLSLHHFSASGATMTVDVGGQGPFIAVGQPISQSVLAGATVSFAAEVSGTSPMSLQWRWFGTNLADGGKLSGAATASLTLSNARPPDMGPYALTVSNAYGSVTSSVALLSVEGPRLTFRLAEGPNAERTNVILTFLSVAGVDSVIEYRDALTESNDWLPILTNAGTGELITNELGIAANPPARFYRVVVP